MLLFKLNVNSTVMKRLYVLVFLSCLLFLSTSYAQGNITYGMQIIDGNNQPVANLGVSAIETSSFQKVVGKTDQNGVVILELNNGIEWSLSIGEIKNDVTIESLPFQAVEMKELYIYDLKAYKRKLKQDPNRTNDGYTEVIQKANADTPFEQPNCMLRLTIKHPDGNKLSGIKVSLVDVSNKTIYTDVTDNEGLAVFVVPNKTNYEIDINSSKNFHFADFGDEFVDRSLEIEFAPTVVKEKIVGDTIIQTTGSSAKPSSERALIKIKVSGGHNNGVNETIILRDLKSGTKYMTVTDNKSMAYFQVPIKRIYMIDFKYSKNADVVNLMSSKQMTTGEKTVHYYPDPRLEFPEKFIPTTENLFINAFNSFLVQQYEKPKDKPFALKFFNGKKVNKNSKEALFKLTLAGSESYCEGLRLPLNIVFVLDKRD